jgi:iron complex outermembrane receptor protein
MASLWLDYKVLGDTVFGGLSFGGGIRYVGSSYAWETDTINFPDEGLRLQNSAYTLYDAAVRYDLGYASPQLKGAQLAVNATNVFNHSYQVCYSRFDCRLGVPMTVMGTLRYRF